MQVNPDHIPIDTPVIAYSRTRQTKEFGVVAGIEQGDVGDGRSRTGVRFTRRQLASLRKRIVYLIRFQGRPTQQIERVDAAHTITGAEQVKITCMST